MGQISQNQNDNFRKISGKRHFDNGSPQKNTKKQRSAFGDISNRDLTRDVVKKAAKKKSKSIIIVPKAPKPSAKITSSQEKNSPLSQPGPDELSWDVIELSQSQESQKCSQNSNCSEDSSMCDVESLNLKNVELVDELSPMITSPVPSNKEENWEDIDKDNLSDIHQVALYASDIFEYYKEREASFPVEDYLNNGLQKDLTQHMRAILVDWLVEVQENFELNHETLYLALKLVDLYLSKTTIARDRLQLVGATALFIACKFDERCPPVVDDFLYICDDAYKRHELLAMEQKVLKTLGFDLGIPLSYRFLRRYAKCGKACMATLTLARYLLESSLLDYRYTRERDSRIAAACLLLAFRLKNVATEDVRNPYWSGTMVHYTGYQASELSDLVSSLNTMLAAPPNKHLATIRTKYSHQVFHEVAKTASLSECDLQSLLIKCQQL